VIEEDRQRAAGHGTEADEQDALVEVEHFVSRGTGIGPPKPVVYAMREELFNRFPAAGMRGPPSLAAW
jgi:hypothetical protein